MTRRGLWRNIVRRALVIDLLLTNTGANLELLAGSHVRFSKDVQRIACHCLHGLD